MNRLYIPLAIMGTILLGITMATILLVEDAAKTGWMFIPGTIFAMVVWGSLESIK